MLVCRCLLYISLSFVGANFSENNYIKVKSCVTTRDNFDTISSHGVKSLIECSSLCSKQAQCESFKISREKPFTCILHNRTLQGQNCSSYPFNEYLAFNDVSSPCLNSGVYDEVTGCTCVDGYIGERCEGLMEDCSEGHTVGLNDGLRTVLLIHPKQSPDPFPVYCEMRLKARTFLMLRDHGSINFNRPWADYKAGFGDLKEEFWLGLDKMHYLTTSKQFRLIIQIKTTVPSKFNRKHFYKDFKISSEVNGFRFTFGTHWSRQPPQDLLDCLVPAIGKKFTTNDVDNDDVAGSNCASVHEGGWWFTDCGECNPTGPMIKPTDGYLLGIPNEVFWKPGLFNYSITKLMLCLVID